MNTKEKIIKAADLLFSQGGYDAISTRDVAEISNTNRALINYYFKNKEGLFESVLNRYFASLSDAIENALLGEGDLKARLINVVAAYMDFLKKNRNYVRIVQREINGGKYMDRVNQHMIHNFRIVLKAIREAYPKTRSGVLAAEHVLISVYGMIITYFTCSDILEKLLDTNPMSEENIQAREKHMFKMIDVVINEFANS
jgi:AcrR family transcriptional regulator